jgi:hypothetical protein
MAQQALLGVGKFQKVVDSLQSNLYVFVAFEKARDRRDYW